MNKFLSTIKGGLLGFFRFTKKNQMSLQSAIFWIVAILNIGSDRFWYFAAAAIVLVELKILLLNYVNQMRTMANLKLEALRAKYNAQRLEAIATLEVYMSNAAGIGEHPQIIEEMDKLVQQVADADDCLEVINKVFSENVDENVNS